MVYAEARQMLVDGIGIEFLIALRVIESVVEATALVTLLRHLDDEVADINLIAELAELLADMAALIKFLCLAIDNLEAIESSLEAHIAADDADIIAHNGLNLLVGLGDEDHLLVVNHAIVVPLRDIVAPFGVFHDLDRVGSRHIGIDESLEQ